MSNGWKPKSAVEVDTWMPSSATMVSEETTPQKGTNAGNLLTAFGVGAGGVATAYGAKKVFEATAPARTELAGNLINSIIKPRHKEYMFGKNPGKGVAQEGIWGANIESLGNKVEQRLGQLNEYSKQIRSLSENATKTVNLDTMFEPLYEVSKEFVKSPDGKTYEIDTFEVDEALKHGWTK